MSDSNQTNDPLEGVARRKLHIAFVLDRSASMKGKRIASLNQAVTTVLPELRKEASRNPQADVFVRQLEFSTGARWRSNDWLPISSYGEGWVFEDLSADGITDMGAAFDLLTEEFDPEKLGAYLYPPVLILVSDGQPTDDWKSALDRFNQSPFGKKPNRTVRAAINIAEADEEVLGTFTGNPETVVSAQNPTQLIAFLKWVTVQASKAASQKRSSTQQATDKDGTAPTWTLPPPITTGPTSSDDDVF